jgi:hypothetical protein
MLTATSGPYSITVVDDEDESSIRFQSSVPGKPFGSYSVSANGLSVHFRGHQSSEFIALLSSIAGHLPGAVETE